MDARWRMGAVWVAGLLLGVALATGGWWWLARTNVPPALAAAPARVAPIEALGVALTQGDAEPQAGAAAPLACAFAPMVAPQGAADGRFALHSALAGRRGTDPAPFLAVAEEAALQGRARDAEVALIVACRVAARSGAATIPVADAQTRLAQHYGALGPHASDIAIRAALAQRVDDLLLASWQALEAALGKEASRTRLASQRLASFRRDAVARATTPEMDAPPGTSQLGAAQSLAGRVPGADEALASRDADIARLYSQARAVSKDPAGMERRHEEALARRQACADEACLLAWFAQRRRALFAEF